MIAPDISDIDIIPSYPLLYDRPVDTWDDIEGTLVARTASVVMALTQRRAGDPETGPLRGATGCPLAFTRNNKLHRDDGPALIYNDGHKVWYQDGEIHRVDGPAVIIQNRQKWFRRGKLHNWAEPAVQGYTASGDRIERWFVNGEDITTAAVSWMIGYDIWRWPLNDAEQFVFAVHFGDRGR